MLWQIPKLFACCSGSYKGIESTEQISSIAKYWKEKRILNSG